MCFYRKLVSLILFLACTNLSLNGMSLQFRSSCLKEKFKRVQDSPPAGTAASSEKGEKISQA